VIAFKTGQVMVKLLKLNPKQLVGQEELYSVFNFSFVFFSYPIT